MEQFDEFSNLLINNKKLKYLKLYDVYINLQAFGRAAKINFSEKRAGPIMLIADLKNNLKFDKTLGAKLKSLDIVMISKKLQKNDKVQEFRLTDAMLGSEALETFTEIIYKKRKLNFVRMEACNITDSSCDKFSTLLKNCKKLVTLDLNGNKITTKGALILVEAALNKGTHNYPSTLYLNENHIGKDFATGLVKLFRNTKKRNVKIFFRKQQSSDAKQLIKKMDAKLKQEGVADLFPRNCIFYKNERNRY